MKTHLGRALLLTMLAVGLASCEAGMNPSLDMGELSEALVLAPAAPSDLTVVAVNAGQANLHWADKSLDETEFRVQRAADEDFSVEFEEWILPPDTMQYSDFTTTGLNTYFYRVFAVNANGASAPSEVVRIFTPVSSPTVVVTTPAGSPALFQSDAINAVEALATGYGAPIAGAEYQLVFDDPPGIFVAQDIVTQPDQDPFVIPAPLAGTPIADATVVPALPPGAILELRITGRVAQAGVSANGYEWRIGGTVANPTFIVYESANTIFPRPRRPVVGDAVAITAYRTVATGPLVAKRITFRAPDPQPVGPAAYNLAALYRGVIESFAQAYQAPGVSYGGQSVVLFNATDNLSVPFRIDYRTIPGFEAFVDEGLIIGNAVEVRFWVSKPVENLPIARQIFPQTQPVKAEPIHPNPTHINNDPVPLGLPPGTFLQFMITGVVTGIDTTQQTYQLGDPANPTVVYGHAQTIPLWDIIRVFPQVGDWVIVTGRRTLEPGPLIADQLLILFDGPAPRNAIPEVGTQIVYLYNGVVTNVDGANGGKRWTVTTGAFDQGFIMDDPHDTAVIDRGGLPSLGVGSLVTVEFIPPTQVLPEANWAPLAFNSTTGQWSASAVLPAVPENRTGTLFMRTTDTDNQTRTIAIPAQLLAELPNTLPVAVADSYLVSGTATLSVSAPGVLGNDTDANLDALTAQLVSAPAGTSSFALNADGSFSFTSATDPATPTVVTFTYQANDGSGLSNVATVSVLVNPSYSIRTFAPVADARVESGAPNSNFGAENRLGADTRPLQGSFVKFDVTGIGRTVYSARLRLFITDPSSNGPALYSTATGWTETGITWANRPPAIGAALGNQGAVTTGTWVEYDVTAAITGPGLYAFTWVADSSNRTDASSREGANPPQLVIDSGGSCVPTSCVTRGANCGSIDDGCGGSLSCGTCTAPATCGGGGVDNVCGAAAPQNLTFLPAGDATVRSTRPTTNYGSSSTVMADTSPLSHGYLKFSVTGLTGTIQSATLRLFVTDPSSNGPALYSTASTWTESTITWDSRPAPTGTALGNLGAVSKHTWVEYDVTAIILGNGGYGFVLVPESSNGTDFSSREGTDPAQLIITTTP